MSFSLPKNVPRFDDSNRVHENTHWRASTQSHNGNAASNQMGGFFPNRELPMYKDKPYSYAASRKYIPLWKRKRILGAVAFCLLVIGAWFGLFSSSKRSGTVSQNWALDMLMPQSPSSKVNWDLRRESVKEAFKLSWDGYERYAWGQDEYYPVSKTGRQMTPSGMGWIIVDALDTLMIMNLTSRLSHAREWIATSLNYTQDHDVNTFETTIRMLGGLLSAHYLSTTFPEMAPLEEDDEGKPGEDLYIEKATDLADRLLGAFDTQSGVPYASINLLTHKGIPSHTDGGSSSTAEAASLQLEFKYLAMLLGEHLYWDAAEKVIQVIDDNGMEDGLLPIFIQPESGTFWGNNIRLGSRGDSYYEYLIKQYLQTSKEEPIYLDLWNQALAGVRKHLITYSSNAHLTVLAERPSGLQGPLSPKMDHLVCFMPGTIALAATEGRKLADARKSKEWGPKQEEEVRLARELTKTCWGMYKAMATGLAPEITFFAIDEPPLMENGGKLTSAEIDWHGDSKEAKQDWRADYVVKSSDSHNLQRPETVESLFYLWRITGDSIYREWGWEMFSSFVNYTALDNGGGFTSLSNANIVPPTTRDNMESFWLAETLKYFYLLFSPIDLLPLDSIIINTEAHIFPRFKLQRGLKTGWKRKPRDANGKIIKADKTDEREIAHTIHVVDASSDTGLPKKDVVDDQANGDREKSKD